MKKFLAANQYQRQHQDDMEKNQEMKPSPLESSGANQINCSSIPSQVDLLSGVPTVSGKINQQKSISSVSNGPDSPPDAMDLINVENTSPPEKMLGVSSSNTNETTFPVVSTPTSSVNSSMPNFDSEALTLFGDQQNEPNVLSGDKIDEIGDMPIPFVPPKAISGQQRNVVLERRVDVEENSNTNVNLANPVICATKSVPIASCDDITKSTPQVPIIENINKQSVQYSTSNNTSETEATTSTFSSESNHKQLSNVVGQISGAKNPYLMKKQSFIDNQHSDFQTNRDLSNKGDSSISSDYNSKVPSNNTPSKNTSLDSSTTSMQSQSEMNVREGQQASATKPVKKPIVPLEKEFKNFEQKQVSPVSTPLSKSPVGSPSSSLNKQIVNKPKEELTKEEKEEQRRRRIHAFSEYQKSLKEQQAKQDEERKQEQEKRRQEEIAISEQRKKLKSVRIPKRNKEYSPLVSPSPASPMSPLIKPPEPQHIHDMATDRFPTQDPRAMYPGAVSQQRPQTSIAIVTPRQPIPSTHQHQVAYMTPQQQPFSVSSQQLTINNTSVNLHQRQQQPLGMPINAPIQQQMPGTGPVNIDLGPQAQPATTNGTKFLEKSFTQHWVGIEDLRVLMLDFKAFKLFVPNMKNNYFHVCTTEVAVQVNSTPHGRNDTCMIFRFQAPPLEFLALVLEDINYGYRLLKKNHPFVLLEKDFPSSGNPPPQQHQPMTSDHRTIPSQQQINSIPNQQTQQMVQNPIQHLSNSQQPAILISQDVSHQQNEQQLLLSSQAMGNLTAQEQQNNPSTKLYYSPQGNTFQDVSHSPNIVTMSGSPQQAQQIQHQISSNSESISNLHSPLSQPSVQQQSLSSQSQPNVYGQMYSQQGNQQCPNPNFTISGVPGHISTPTESSSTMLSMNVGPQSSQLQQNPIQPPQQQTMSNFQQTPLQNDLFQTQNLHTQSLNSEKHQITAQNPLKAVAIEQHLSQHQQVQDTVQAPQVPRIVLRKDSKFLYPDEMNDTLYPSLKPKELDKVIRCNRCGKKFSFLSEHLVHLEMHTNNVESTVEMSINQWVQERRLKCDLCKKFKTSYTLQYARHRDKHILDGLACKKCMMPINTPHEYAEHLKIHHPKQIFSEPEAKEAGQNEPGQSNSLAETSSNELEKSDQSIQDALDHFEDTDVIEANIGKEIGDEEMLESIFNADNTEQKGILDDSHEHEEDPSNKDKEIEHSSMPILMAGEEASKAARTKSVDSVGNEGDLLKAMEKCDDQEYMKRDMIDSSENNHLESKTSNQNSITNEQNVNQPYIDDEESVDDSVLSLVKDLSGRIAEQSFGFDKDEVGPAAFTSSRHMNTSEKSQATKQIDNCNSDHKSSKLDQKASTIQEGRNLLDSETSRTCQNKSSIKNEQQLSKESIKSHENKSIETYKNSDEREITQQDHGSFKPSNQHCNNGEFQDNKVPSLKIKIGKSSSSNIQKSPILSSPGSPSISNSPYYNPLNNKDSHEKIKSKPKSEVLSDSENKDFGLSQSSIKDCAVDKHKIALESSDKLKKQKSSVSPQSFPSEENKLFDVKDNFDNAKTQLSSESSTNSDTERPYSQSLAKSTSKHVSQNGNPSKLNSKPSNNDIKTSNLNKPISVFKSEKSISEDDLNMQLQLSEDDEEAKELDKEMELDNPSSNLSSSPENDTITTENDRIEALESPLEHSCGTCGDKFKTTTSLKIHRLMCGKDTSSTTNNVPKSPSPKLNRKSPCISVSSSSSDDDDTASESTSFTCENCTMQFRSQMSFKMHQRLCKKKSKVDLKQVVTTKEVSQETIKRQYIIPEDLSDYTSNRRYTSYTSDEEEDNSESIYKRKSIQARERRKSWLKNKSQKQSNQKSRADQFNEVPHPPIPNNRQTNLQQSIIRNKLLNIGASPSSSSVPCSSAPSGDSSFSSSDGEGVSLSNTANPQSSFERATTDSDKVISDEDPEDHHDRPMFSQHKSILSSHFNKKSVQKNIEKLKFKKSQMRELPPVTFKNEPESYSRINSSIQTHVEEPKSLKVKIKFGGNAFEESDTSVRYIPPKRGRGRPRGSKNVRGGRVPNHGIVNRNAVTPSVARPFSNNLQRRVSETSTNFKNIPSKSKLFPSIPNHSEIPLPVQSTPKQIVPTRVSIDEKKSVLEDKSFTYPFDSSKASNQTFQINNQDIRKVPKLKIKLPTPIPKKTSPGMEHTNHIESSSEVVNWQQSFPPFDSDFIPDKNPTSESLLSQTNNLSEISDSLTEISDVDEVENNANHSHIASNSAIISKSIENSTWDTHKDNDKLETEEVDTSPIWKRVILSGCSPTKWHRDNGRNCDSVDVNKLLTQLECLSCSVSIGCLDITKNHCSNEDIEYKNNVNFGNDNVLMIEDDIETVKKTLGYYRSIKQQKIKSSRFLESDAKYSTVTTSYEDKCRASENKRVKEDGVAKKSVPPLRIRLSSLTSNRKDDTKGIKGDKLSDLLSNVVSMDAGQNNGLRSSRDVSSSISKKIDENVMELSTRSETSTEVNKESYVVSGNIHSALDLLVNMGSADETVSGIITDILHNVVKSRLADNPIWMNDLNGSDNTHASKENKENSSPDETKKTYEAEEVHCGENSMDNNATEYSTYNNESSNDTNEATSNTTLETDQYKNVTSYDNDLEPENQIRRHDEFQIIRVPSVTKKSTNRRKKSGLSGFDYKKRKRNKPKKLDKLIIKNISKLLPCKESSIKPGDELTFPDIQTSQDREKQNLSPNDICSAMIREVFDNLPVWPKCQIPRVPPLIIRAMKSNKSSLEFNAEVEGNKLNGQRINDTIQETNDGASNKTSPKCNTIEPAQRIPPLKLNIKSLLNRKNSLRLGAKRSLNDMKENLTKETPISSKRKKLYKSGEVGDSFESAEDRPDTPNNLVNELVTDQKKDDKDSLKFISKLDSKSISSCMEKVNSNSNHTLKSFRGTSESRETSNSPSHGSRPGSSLLNFTTKKPKTTSRKEMWILGGPFNSASKKKKMNMASESQSLNGTNEIKQELPYNTEKVQSRLSTSSNPNTGTNGQTDTISNHATTENERQSRPSLCTCSRKKDMDEVLIDDVLESFDDPELINELPLTEDEGSIDENQKHMSTYKIQDEPAIIYNPQPSKVMRRKIPTLVRYYKDDKIDFLSDKHQSTIGVKEPLESYPLIEYPGQMSRFQHRQYLYLRKKQSASDSLVKSNKIEEFFKNVDYNAKISRLQIRQERSMRKKFGGSSILSDSFIVASNVLNDMITTIVSDYELERSDLVGIKQINKKKRPPQSSFSRNGYVKRRRKCFGFTKSNTKQEQSKQTETSIETTKPEIENDDSSDFILTNEKCEEPTSADIVTPLVTNIVSDAISCAQAKADHEDMWTSIMATAKATLVDHDDSSSLVLSSEVDDLDHKIDHYESNDGEELPYMPKINNNPPIIIRCRSQNEAAGFEDDAVDSTKSILTHKYLPYQYDYGSSLGDDESMSSDAMCNNDTSQDEDDYVNHKENFAAQIKSKHSNVNGRQKSSNKSPFSSSGYVRRRRRKRIQKKVGISSLAKENSTISKAAEIPTSMSSSLHMKPELSNLPCSDTKKSADRIAETVGETEVVNTNTIKSQDIKECDKEKLTIHTVQDNKISSEASNKIQPDTAKSDQNSLPTETSSLNKNKTTAKNINKESTSSQFVQRNFFVKDEFVNDEPIVSESVIHDDTPVDLGKGKRKRFQNVRMLDIEEAVGSKIKSPIRPEQAVERSPNRKNLVKDKSLDVLNHISDFIEDSDLIEGDTAKETKLKEPEVNKNSNSDKDIQEKKDSSTSGKKQNKKKPEIRKSKIVKTSTPSKVIPPSNIKPSLKRNRKSNTDKKLNLSIEEELLIINKTMEHSSTNEDEDSNTSDVDSIDENRKTLKGSPPNKKSLPVSNSSTTVLPPRKRKTISTLENNQELITETLRTCENEEIVVSSSLIQKNTLPSISTNSSSTLRVNDQAPKETSRRDLLKKKATIKRRVDQSTSESPLVQESVISQMAKKVIEKSSLVAQRRLGGLPSKVVSPSPGKMTKLASESILSKAHSSRNKNADLQRRISFDPSIKSKRLENTQPKGPILSTQNKNDHLSTEINTKNKNSSVAGKRLFIEMRKKMEKNKPKETILVDEEVSFKVNGEKAKVK